MAWIRTSFFVCAFQKNIPQTITSQQYEKKIIGKKKQADVCQSFFLEG